MTTYDSEEIAALHSQLLQHITRHMLNFVVDGENIKAFTNTGYHWAKSSSLLLDITLNSNCVSELHLNPAASSKLYVSKKVLNALPQIFKMEQSFAIKTIVDRLPRHGSFTNVRSGFSLSYDGTCVAPWDRKLNIVEVFGLHLVMKPSCLPVTQPKE